ncbi:MAG: ATP-binding protein [Planctomycetota bacterium]|jgi:signal transduction histidine kinase|nr:ATP-binding protein [Planctomycetota bacterium]MDP6520463.1 ATP-binding protein [Planctomycetota bacterium]MDP6837581.1 ATP-binding protein [Planctomycetota bacterium]
MDEQQANQAAGGDLGAGPQGSARARGAAGGRRAEGGDEGPPADQPRDLSRLAAGLAHEIKNPLSTMSIQLTLLEEEWNRGLSAADGEEAPQPTGRERRSLKRLTALQREVKRLSTILDDFMRYARGGELNRSPEDLVQLVRETLEFVEPEDNALRIRHHADLPSALPLAMLDREAMRQALLNLFVNARQAMVGHGDDGAVPCESEPKGGELMVRLNRSGIFAEVSVTDTGVGMGPEELERCFRVYYSTKRGGSGLGLPTVARVIEEHGGSISVVSEVGRGTSFTLRLPLLVELPGKARTIPVQAQELEPGAGGQQISDSPATDSPAGDSGDEKQ